MTVTNTNIGQTTEEHRFECEARFWMEYAVENGNSVWQSKKIGLIKSRGNDYVVRLVSEMERLRKL